MRRLITAMFGEVSRPALCVVKAYQAVQPSGEVALRRKAGAAIARNCIGLQYECIVM